MSESPKSATPKYSATAKETPTTTDVDFIVASLVGHWTLLNSAITSLKKLKMEKFRLMMSMKLVKRHGKKVGLKCLLIWSQK